MRKVVFVSSHAGSGSGALCRSLDSNPRVQFYGAGLWYDHPSVVESLAAMPHKMNNSAAVYLDELLYNHSLSHKAIYRCARFVYLVRDPRGTFSEIGRAGGKKANEPLVRYYAYRLRRLCEMARCTPGSLLLTWDDLNSGRAAAPLEKFLGLKQPAEIKTEPPGTLRLPPDQFETARESFERHLYYLRSLPLLSCHP